MIKYFAKYKSTIAQRIPAESILDYGCGDGRNIKHFIKYYPTVYGYDPAYSISVLPKSKVDLIFVANVLHHSGINELKNIIRYGDRIIIFEHNPYNLITRLIVKFAKIDKGVTLIKRKELIKKLENLGFKIIKKKYTLFLTQYYIYALET